MYIFQLKISRQSALCWDTLDPIPCGLPFPLRPDGQVQLDGTQDQIKGRRDRKKEDDKHQGKRRCAAHREWGRTRAQIMQERSRTNATARCDETLRNSPGDSRWRPAHLLVVDLEAVAPPSVRVGEHGKCQSLRIP